MTKRVGEQTPEELAELLGQSGVFYRCRCGAMSEAVREPRLADCPGWSMRFAVVNQVVNRGKRNEGIRPRSVAVFLCDECCTRSAKEKKAALEETNKQRWERIRSEKDQKAKQKVERARKKAKASKAPPRKRRTRARKKP